MNEQQKNKYREWRFGLCYYMVFALIERTGWEAEIVSVDLHEYSTVREHPVHAYIVSPEGKLYDALGEISYKFMDEIFFENTLRKFENKRYKRFATREDLIEYFNKLNPEWQGYEPDDKILQEAKQVLDEQLQTLLKWLPEKTTKIENDLPSIAL